MSKFKNDGELDDSELYEAERRQHQLETARIHARSRIWVAIIGLVAVIAAVLVKTPDNKPVIVAIIEILQEARPGSSGTIVVVPATQAPIIITATPQPPVVIVATQTEPGTIVDTFSTPEDISQSGSTDVVPELVTRLDLSPATENGTKFQCDRSGTYIITIEKGVYSPYSGGIGGKWRTFFFIYHNEVVTWQKNQYGYIAPAAGKNEMDTIGEMEQVSQTKVAAEQAAIDLYTSVSCQAGEYLRFVAAEERGAYKDNFGSVTVRIDYLPI